MERASVRAIVDAVGGREEGGFPPAERKELEGLLTRCVAEAISDSSKLSSHTLPELLELILHNHLSILFTPLYSIYLRL